MPRRPPARIRAPQIPRAVPGERRPQVPGVSRGTNAAIHLIELRGPLRPGETAVALLRWRAKVHGPRRCVARVDECGPPCCAGDPRWVLEQAVGLLRGRPRRELQAVIDDVDRVFLDRTYPDPRAPEHWQWWQRRC